jgi:hypothetical protein
MRRKGTDSNVVSALQTEQQRVNLRPDADVAPLARRRALRAAVATIAAAVGATLLSAGRPKRASAADDIFYTSTDSPATLEADNTGGGIAVLAIAQSGVGVHATSASNTAVSGSSTSGTGVLGMANSSTKAGVEGDNSGAGRGLR